MKKQTALKLLATDTYESLNRINSIDETAVEHLNVSKVRMVPPILPLNTKICGQARYIKGSEAICIMEDQTRHIY